MSTRTPTKFEGDLENRLAEIDARLQELKVRPKTGWDKLAVLAPIVQAILLAIVTFFLTGRVTNAIQRKQIEVSSVSAMRELIGKLGDEKITLADANAAAMTLAAFGNYAVPSLIHVIQNGGVNSTVAAERALRAVGIGDQKVVCESLRMVISNRTQLFSWSVHQTAIRVLGDLECREAVTEILVYRQLVDSGTVDNDLQQFRNLVAFDSNPSEQNLITVRDDLKRTLEILQRPKRQ